MPLWYILTISLENWVNCKDILEMWVHSFDTILGQFAAKFISIPSQQYFVL